MDVRQSLWIQHTLLTKNTYLMSPAYFGEWCHPIAMKMEILDIPII